MFSAYVLKQLYVLVTVSMFLSACSSTHEADTYVWHVSKNSSLKNYFPEKDAPTIPGMPDLRTKALKVEKNHKISFGLAFAGGGTRAATMALGQLRAMHKLGWIKNVQYISAVSGGAWTIVPYSFLPGDNTNCSSRELNEINALTSDDKLFLGEYTPPENLTLKDAKTNSPNGSLAKEIANSWLGVRTLGHLFSNFNDKAYATAVGDTYLRPFNLSENIGWFDKETRSFAYRQKSIKNSKIPSWNFNFLRCGRPYPIINATVITKGFMHRQEHMHRLEITPDYTGVRVPYDIPGEKGKFGGYYVQSFAYDSHKRILSKPTTDVMKSDGDFSQWTVNTGGQTGSFSLSDVVGVSGAAPQEILTKIGIGNMGFPEYHLSPNDVALKTPKGDFYHGDGGHLENLGLMPLFARKVQNIIAFVNTVDPFGCDKSKCKSEDLPDKDEDMIAKYVVSFFEKMEKPDGSPDKYGDNLIFEEGTSKLSQLVSAFRTKKREGEPLVYCDAYNIKENEHYGIYDTAQYKPNLCWVYLDRSNDWLETLTDPKISDYAQRRWRNLPHFKTFLPSLLKPSLVDLSNAEVKLGSNLAAWTMCESAEYISGNLSPALGASLKKSCAIE